MNTDKIYAEAVANEYAPKAASKVVALKKLDRKAKLPSDIFAYTFGVAGTLILGVGMCLSMGVLCTATTAIMAAGVVVGVVGIIMMGINYTVYKRLRERGKQKYAYEIVELARQIAEQPDEE